MLYDIRIEIYGGCGTINESEIYTTDFKNEQEAQEWCKKREKSANNTAWSGIKYSLLGISKNKQKGD